MQKEYIRARCTAYLSLIVNRINWSLANGLSINAYVRTGFYSWVECVFHNFELAFFCGSLFVTSFRFFKKSIYLSLKKRTQKMKIKNKSRIDWTHDK